MSGDQHWYEVTLRRGIPEVKRIEDSGRQKHYDALNDIGWFGGFPYRVNNTVITRARDLDEALTQAKRVFDGDASQDCKRDSGKPNLNLVPPEAWLLGLTPEELEGIARVREYGDSKYTPESWRAVENAVPRYRAAGLRHVAAMAAGEELDPESGLPHRHHALCNAVLVVAHMAGGASNEAHSTLDAWVLPSGARR